VRQVFFFKNGRKDIKNENKNNEFMFNLFFYYGKLFLLCFPDLIIVLLYHWVF